MDSTAPTAPPAATLIVCTTCRRAGTAPDDGERPGATLLRRLGGAEMPAGVTLRPVECLSVCQNGCAVALTCAGKWTYVYGGLDPDVHAEDILAGAALYAAAADGLVPWRARPEVFRKQSVARIPPLAVLSETQA